jgi:hypothetical protein
LKVKFDWFHWTLGNGPKPAFVADRITYYICGQETWHTTSSLQSLSGTSLVLHLTSSGRADDVFHSGVLSETAGAAGADGFVIDLDDEDKTAIERQQRPEHAGPGASYGVAFPPPYHSMFAALYGDDPTDQSFTIDLQGMGVVYHSAVFRKGPTFVGRPSLDLWLKLDVPDADICVFLNEVRRDGRAILLSSTIRRLRFAQGWDRPVFAKAGEPFQVSLTDFRFFARTLADGSRLRLTVRAISGLYFDSNEAMRQPDGARRAHVELMHGGDNGSILSLPVAAALNGDQA